MVIVGDVKHSRVARTDLHALRTLGVGEIRVCGPQSLLPDDETLKGCVVGDDFDAMLEGVDALMMLRLQRERMEEGLVPSLEQYHAQYGLTRARLARAGKDAAVLHPGPINRGVEVTDDVADGRNLGCCARSPTGSPCAWPYWKPCWADHFGGCRPLVGTEPSVR